MEPGKHDIPNPINEGLEAHYKEQIGLRDEKIRGLLEELNTAKLEIERLHFDIDMQKARIEVLEKALVEETVARVSNKA